MDCPNRNDQVVRYIFPAITHCTHCGCVKWRATGRSRTGTIEYRSCIACNNAYKIGAIAAHVDRGGEQSDIVRLD